MIDGRRLHPFVKIALVVVVGYVVVSVSIRYALFPIAVGIVAWGGYQIYKAERRGSSKPKRARASLKRVRIDPEKDLTIPKDWR